MILNEKIPLVSIIIPTFNRSKLLSLTLHSIVKQSLNKDFIQVIIVDDGSTDNTLEVVNSFMTQLNIKYYYQEDRGFRVAKARNLGIKNADAPICIFIDSGVVLGRKVVEHHLKTHYLNEGFCAVIGYVYGFDDYNVFRNDILKLMDYHSPDESIKMMKKNNILDSREPLYQKHGDDLSKWPAPWVIFWTSNVSLRRDLLLDVGLFDESYQSWGGEDTDLGLALFIRNTKFILNRSIQSIHYPHDKEYAWASDNSDGLKDFKKKQKYMYKKYRLQSIKIWFNTYYDNLNEKLLNMKKVKEVLRYEQ